MNQDFDYLEFRVGCYLGRIPECHQLEEEYCQEFLEQLVRVGNLQGFVGFQEAILFKS